ALGDRPGAGGNRPGRQARRGATAGTAQGQERKRQDRGRRSVGEDRKAIALRAGPLYSPLSLLPRNPQVPVRRFGAPAGANRFVREVAKRGGFSSGKPPIAERLPTG